MSQPSETHPATIRPDKIASVVANLKLGRRLEIVSQGAAAEGAVVAAKALREKRIYNQIELADGRMSKIVQGDVIVGALGRRMALKGYVGEIPAAVRPGDRLHLLNLGGVIGRCTSASRDLGKPIEVEVLGFVAKGGRPLNIAEAALPASPELRASKPLILVAASCMNAGKTVAACAILKGLSDRGLRVAAAKLSGVACLKDTLAMQDHGAVRALSFLDCGIPSTAGRSDLRPVARTLLTELNRDAELDAIVVELGDGIIGDYGVGSVLKDREIRRFAKALVFCATDLVAAWGGAAYLRDLGFAPDLISGPATDNEVGLRHVAQELRLPAINALGDPSKLAAFVEERLSPARRQAAPRASPEPARAP